MTTITTTETVEHLPLEAIIPDPGNRKIVLDAQFVGSIRTHGVIQPLLVSPHPDDQGRYHLVAGHRRLGAARKIGLDTVPALVRTLTEQERLELGLVDNIQREGIRPSDQAVAMGRLVEYGMSVGALAKRIGRSAAYVRDRLKLLELPVAARRLVDEDVITIEQGLVLVRLVDHPEVLAATLAQIGDHHGNIEWLVDSALRRIASDAKVAEGRAKAEGKGLRIVEHEGHQPSGYVEVASYGGLDVDAKAHAKEPCHAVVISPRDGALTPVCTDRKRHTRKGTSTIKSATKAGPGDTARAQAAAKREATEHRREFIAGLLSRRPSKADVLALVLPNYLDDANSIEQAAVAKLLGLEPAPEAGSHDRWGDALRDYTAASETNSLRACLAFSLAQGEDAIAGGWAYERGLRHREFLAGKGYEPTAYELEQAEATRVRNEESRARTAEFRSRTEPGDAAQAAEQAGEAANGEPDADDTSTEDGEGDEAFDGENDEALDDDADLGEPPKYGGPTREEGTPAGA
ncbi:MAG: ParB family transcriptional regulator, chromosome partitioning protein [Actinomycetota bacterium]|jgi:ParB family chromosome partitioning protein|nr:ParB family transcriptional regulator, chromosome partitioning protein [Actinomycetota bacterium]